MYSACVYIVSEYSSCHHQLACKAFLSLVIVMTYSCYMQCIIFVICIVVGWKIMN